jgi:hypothetical protein
MHRINNRGSPGTRHVKDRCPCRQSFYDLNIMAMQCRLYHRLLRSVKRLQKEETRCIETNNTQRALTNLRNFAPPPTNYYKCPLRRRAAVLILLFADKVGDLRVVLTIRSSGLKSCKSLRFWVAPYGRELNLEAGCTSAGTMLIRYSTDAGQAALPGGKADTLLVSMYPKRCLRRVTYPVSRKRHGKQHAAKPSRR